MRIDRVWVVSLISACALATAGWGAGTPAALADPAPTLEIKGVTYVDENSLDVSIAYNCASGAADQLEVRVEERTPDIPAEELRGLKDARIGAMNYTPTCNGEDQTGQVRVPSRDIGWNHPGSGSVSLHATNGLVRLGTVHFSGQW